LNYRVLIVDDEKPARQELRYILENNMEQVEIREADCAENALEILKKNEVDLVFLDINMPGMDGISLSKEMRRIDCSTHIIFATAYDTYALQAFELDALDYILKPFEDERIKQTVRKIMERMELENRTRQKSTPNEDRTNKEREKQHKISLWKDEKIIPVDFKDIVFVYAEEGSSIIKTSVGAFPSKDSLCNIEKRLSENDFLKVHRSYIINVNFVKEIAPWFNNTYIVRMKHYEEESIPVSRSYIKQFREEFQL